MKIIELNLGFTPLKIPMVICLGFFDGLHLGHQQLINKVKKVAAEKNLSSAMLTLSHSPQTILAGSDELILTTPQDKAELLSNQLDYLFVLNFNKELASLTPKEFINQILLPLNIKVAVCGFDYRFGCRGSGYPDDIVKLSENQIIVKVIPPYLQNDLKVSSTTIHQLLNQGRIEIVNELLGRPYQIRGIVKNGKGIGKALGYPTINLSLLGNYHLPSNGVYAVTANGHPGMANIGNQPTFSSNSILTLEIHLFDLQNSFYDQKFTINFYSFIRAEKDWGSKEELVKQLQKDEKEIRAFFQIKKEL